MSVVHLTTCRKGHVVPCPAIALNVFQPVVLCTSANTIGSSFASLPMYDFPAFVPSHASAHDKHNDHLFYPVHRGGGIGCPACAQGRGYWLSWLKEAISNV